MKADSPKLARIPSQTNCFTMPRPHSIFNHLDFAWSSFELYLEHTVDNLYPQSMSVLRGRDYPRR
jgi:hypothetical protein